MCAFNAVLDVINLPPHNFAEGKIEQFAIDDGGKLMIAAFLDGVRVYAIEDGIHKYTVKGLIKGNADARAVDLWFGNDDGIIGVVRWSDREVGVWAV